MYRTLVVDDEENIRSFIAKSLSLVGHKVETARNGKDALEIIRDEQFDLVFLDLNLGGKIDGIRVLEALRWRWPETAAVILTGHGSLDSAMAAIREGVDLYLQKPAGLDAIRDAATEAIEKRRKYFSQQKEELEKVEFEAGPIYIHTEKLIVRLNGQDVSLTSREFKLLTHLVQNTHRVVPPKELTQVVGGFKAESAYEARNYIKWYIHQLRGKIESDPSDPKRIINVREGGYRFISPDS